MVDIQSLDIFISWSTFNKNLKHILYLTRDYKLILYIGEDKLKGTVIHDETLILKIIPTVFDLSTLDQLEKLLFQYRV